MTHGVAKPGARLRMAVIGCGPMGGWHARAIASSELASLAAVCDPDGARRTAAAECFGVPAYETLRQLLADESIDSVTIATPDHLHVDVALAAIEAGCHVFCEKPLATDIVEAERIVRAAAEQNVHLAVDYNRRFAFGYRTAKGLLDEGKIGRLRYGLLRVSDRTPRPEVARNPFVIFTTLLTHHFDLMRYYGGEICRLHAISAERSPGALVRNVVLSLQFRSGSIGTIVADYRDNLARTSEWMELGGDLGSLAVEDITRRVIFSGADPDRRETYEPDLFGAGGAFYDSVLEQVRVFIEHVARGQKPPVTGEDGWRGLQWAAAAVESLRSGQAVEITP